MAKRREFGGLPHASSVGTICAAWYEQMGLSRQVCDLNTLVKHPAAEDESSANSAFEILQPCFKITAWAGHARGYS